MLVTSGVLVLLFAFSTLNLAYADGGPGCVGDAVLQQCYEQGSQSVLLPAGAKDEGRSGHSLLCTTLSRSRH